MDKKLAMKLIELSSEIRRKITDVAETIANDGSDEMEYNLDELREAIEIGIMQEGVILGASGLDFHVRHQKENEYFGNSLYDEPQEKALASYGPTGMEIFIDEEEVKDKEETEEEHFIHYLQNKYDFTYEDINILTKSMLDKDLTNGLSKEDIKLLVEEIDLLANEGVLSQFLYEEKYPETALEQPEDGLDMGDNTIEEVLKDYGQDEEK